MRIRTGKTGDRDARAWQRTAVGTLARNGNIVSQCDLFLLSATVAGSTHPPAAFWENNSMSLSSRHALKKLCRGHNPDGLEFLKAKEVSVAGNNKVCIGRHCAF